MGLSSDLPLLNHQHMGQEYIYIHILQFLANSRVKLKIQLLKAEKTEGNSEHVNQTCCFKLQMKRKEGGR